MRTSRNVRLCALALCVVMTALFAGCSLLQKAQDKAVEFSLETAVDVAIDAAVQDNEEIGRVAEHMQARVDMQVLSSTISGDGVTAQLKVTAPDLSEFIGTFDLNDYANEQELCDAVIAAIDKAPVTEKEVTVGLKKNGSEYELLELDAFLDAYLGGGIEILEDLQDQSKK